MRNSFDLAVRNVISYGDTDIFPYPIENRLFRGHKEQVLQLLDTYHAHFQSYLVQFPPAHLSSLAPVSFTGFRWATQLDPFWNVYFLGCVLSISDQIERARLPISQQRIFSYRYNPNQQTASLFEPEIGWRRFMQRSLELATEFSYVVVCDISEFYPRLGHHKLDNALGQLGLASDIPSRIMRFLRQYSGHRSFGLPIGGPASRLLSELVLNQVDRLLIGREVEFVRFADDYHLFANSEEDAYEALLYLSEKLFENQGLSLQKSKTRISTAADFLSTSPLRPWDAPDGTGASVSEDTTGRAGVQDFMRISLRFDPYSPSATEDYETLKETVQEFDIVGLLNAELAKSRIHIAFSRQVLKAIRFLDAEVRDNAVKSLIDNSENLFPVFSTVATAISDVFDDLGESTKEHTVSRVRNIIEQNSRIVQVDMHLAFALRILSKYRSLETETLMQQVYERRTATIVRREIILSMARWRVDYWLSDLSNRYRELSDWEKRAFIVASYSLGDEGKHWRQNIQREFSPFEAVIRDWARSRKNVDADWVVPI